MKIHDLVVSVLEEDLGFVIMDDYNNDFSILDYINESLLFVQFILAIENRLDIELSDDFLDYDLYYSMSGFVEKLESYIEENRHESI